ncbi:RdgB/HAM1 family non-canonical purine NTP pyrophosphatase [Chitinophagaceae bacterium LB-8]|uniref:dITP/XTP pyrophosphatase n=1 Tax=Paraflavisolibacter caeni TaxID=2982496 RepID=A0A9X3BFE5_9BACT|nr:RdgB/HAM1 family non-canonical purine NTP pyrophosphatase [Paraflavisolibacter caeni]MCU7548649.1 RdgB/HAM1 family non-canonical purine NTP pyrophosphatase [Paraflavisolibacter caeni]
MKIIFATNNQHKVEEVKTLLPSNISIISLREAGIDAEIPEPHDTLQENAAEKARTIRTMTGENCFSEDTGLEVQALNGEPGVKSARYAGEEKTSQQNMEKLLARLGQQEDRRARFRTVICLILADLEYHFEGICEGVITYEPRGDQGFGYDPVFIPNGAEKTFAEMGMKEKNKFSHRKKAVAKLVEFLNQMSLQQ